MVGYRSCTGQQVTPDMQHMPAARHLQGLLSSVVPPLKELLTACNKKKPLPPWAVA
jgi:hypothetical protein